MNVCLKLSQNFDINTLDLNNIPSNINKYDVFLELLNVNKRSTAIEFFQKNSLSKINYLMASTFNYNDNTSISVFNPLFYFTDARSDVKEFETLMSFFEHSLLFINPEDTDLTTSFEKILQDFDSDKDVTFSNHSFLALGYLFSNAHTQIKKTKYLDSSHLIKNNLFLISDLLLEKYEYKATLKDIENIISSPVDSENIIAYINKITKEDLALREIALYQVYMKDSFTQNAECAEKIKNEIGDGFNYNKLSPNPTEETFLSKLFKSKDFDRILSFVQNGSIDLSKEWVLLSSLPALYIQENDQKVRNSLEKIFTTILEGGIDLNQKIRENSYSTKESSCVDLIEEELSSFFHTGKKRSENRAKKLKTIFSVLKNTALIKLIENEKNELTNILNQGLENPEQAIKKQSKRL